MFISLTGSDGRLGPEQAHIISQAWNGGWEESILRALIAEETLSLYKNLVNELINEGRKCSMGDMLSVEEETSNVEAKYTPRRFPTLVSEDIDGV